MRVINAHLELDGSEVARVVEGDEGGMPVLIYGELVIGATSVEAIEALLDALGEWHLKAAQS